MSKDMQKSQGLEYDWQAPLLSRPPLLVFHVNDSTDDQVLFQTACKNAQVPFHWHVAESAERGISYLDSLISMNRKQSVRWPDLIVLDLMLPGFSGLKVLEHIRNTPEIQLLPVIILTGHEEPELREQALKLGANSYHIKPADFEGWVEFVRTLYLVWSMSRRPKL
jgi:CheY-like chemotaxis protein